MVTKIKNNENKELQNKEMQTGIWLMHPYFVIRTTK